METLKPEQLRRRCDPSSLGFTRTDELEPIHEAPGQSGARDAVRLAAHMRAAGYNVFAMGSPQVAKRQTVISILKAEAELARPISDWVYLQDFADGRRPRVARLVPGYGRQLVSEFQQFLDELRAALPVMFEDEAYQAQASDLAAGFQEQQRAELLALQSEAEQHGLRMLQTPQGFAFAPVGDDGEVIDGEHFEALDPDRRQAITEQIEAFNRKLLEIMQALPLRQQAMVREQRELARRRASSVVHGLLARLRQRFQAYDLVIEYVKSVEANVLEVLPRMVALEAQNDPDLDDLLRRYRPNLVVDNADVEAPPIVYESNPTLENLLGRIDHVQTPAGVFTDAGMITVGALQRANGGFLLLDAERVLTRPLAWDALERALIDRVARIETPAQLFSLALGAHLEPQPIELDVKVILLGAREIYYLLSAYDREFPGLFKIAADFEDEVPFDGEALPAYARSIAGIAESAGLHPLDAAAVARVIEYSARYVEDAERLTTHTRALTDMVTEADFVCGQRGGEVITREDIDAAVSARRARLSRIQRRTLEAITRDVLLIATAGERVGQINGLSVLTLGAESFGQPSRISATARAGNGRVIDIEREARLGGNLHTKALMIVSSFLGARFARSAPLSLHASIVFEQSYGGVDGDSASVAEVCALVSAICARPVKQSLAVTGSMNQLGEVQAIGGVNEKIEGFFRVCQARGLDGTHGVVIPAANVKHLMLDDEIVAAAEAGLFDIHAVDHVDEALALFTGLEVGVQDADGRFPDGSLGAAVCEALQKFAESLRGDDDDDEAGAGDGQEPGA